MLNSNIFFQRLKNNDYTLNIFSKIYSIIIGIISSAFYIRYLGIGYKGIYSYINQIVNILTLILGFGIYQSFSFYYRRYGREIYKRYVDLFIVQFTIYVMFVLPLLYAFQVTSIFSMIVIQLPFIIFKTQYDNIMYVENVRIFIYFDVIIKSFLAVYYYFLWKFLPTNLYYLIWGTVISNLITCIVYAKLTNYKIDIARLKIPRKFIKEVLKFGYLPMASSLLLTLNYSVDIIFLKKMGTTVELSVYSLAATIMNYIWLIPNAFKEVLISRISRSDAEKSVLYAIKISIVFTLICFIGFALCGKIALKIIFGVDFIDSYLVVLILFIGAISMIFFKMLSIVFLAEGKRKSYFVILLISVIMNLIANYFFIPIWGMYGAAWASVISYSICGIMFLLYYCIIKKYKVMRFLTINQEDILFLKQLSTKIRNR